MKKIQLITAEQAAAMVNNEDTIAICGCENILSPNTILKAIGERFRQTGEPYGLTEIHPIIVGMGPEMGLEHFAQPNMVKRAIGSGFSYLKTSKYTAMLRDNEFEAHVLPMGTVFQMIRDLASGKSHTITDVGVGTFVDPELEGGRMNEKAEESLAERVIYNGKPHLSYRLSPINVAIVRGTTADEYGNISLEDEPVSLGIKALAMAAKNSGGKVIAQVRRVTKAGTIHPKMIEVPGILVDAVVVDPEQNVSGSEKLNPYLTGEVRMPAGEVDLIEAGPKKIVLKRASDEVRENDVVNLGVGIPGDMPRLLVEIGNTKMVTFFPEHGSVGGIPAERSFFGTSINPEAIVDSTQVFDFFRGGGLNTTFLGFGQIDEAGNVNVSKFNGIIPGCGGFIDITYKTPRVVFCGTFSAGSPEIQIGDGKLTVVREGRHSKLVKQVEQVTFNGQEALKKGQQVLYVTERAVFSLQKDGIYLEEVAPGVDVKTQIIDLIPFEIKVRESLRNMNPSYFY